MTKCRAALVLTAGLGTRLRPLSRVRAKPAMPVAGEVIVRRIIRSLVAHQISEIVLNLHHRPETIARAVGDGIDIGARVRYSWEQPNVLGTAGGIRQALPLVGGGPLLVLNGDTLTDVDLASLADAHATSGALVTMALVAEHDPARYGGVRLDDRGHVVGFSARGAAQPEYHFVGAQMVEAQVVESLAVGQPAATVGGVYDELIARQPGAICGWTCKAAFWDVGTISDYWSTSWAFAAREGAADVLVGRGAKIADTARVSRSILWDDVDVSSDAFLEGCVVTDGVRVPPGAEYRDLIVMQAPDGTLEIAPRPQ